MQGGAAGAMSGTAACGFWVSAWPSAHAFVASMLAVEPMAGVQPQEPEWRVLALHAELEPCTNLNPARAQAASPHGPASRLTVTVTGWRSRESYRLSHARQYRQESSRGAVQAEGQYNWSRNWWPVLPEEMMHRDRPNAITILGRDLVVWWNALESQWVVMQDSCPHRLSPLSQGRLASPGVLTCSYHGWSFGPSGACASIPQLSAATAVTAGSSGSSSSGSQAAEGAAGGQRTAAAALLASKRTCARAYPSRLVDDLLLVWLDDSPEGVELSKTQLSAMPEYTGSFPWTINQLHNDASYWMEQTMDPSHANFLHAGAMNIESVFSMDNAIPMETEPISASDMSLEGGFSLSHGGYEKAKVGMKATRDFHPPGFVRLNYNYPSGFRINYLIYIVPVMPGQCRTYFKAVLGPDVDKCVRAPTGPGASRDRQSSGSAGGSINESSSASSASSSQGTASAGAVQGQKKQQQSGLRLSDLLSLVPLLLHPKKLAAAVTARLPHWARLSHTLNDQDTVLLHLTEQVMVKRGQSDRDYTMVAAADEGVAAINRWMRQSGYLAQWQSLFPGSTITKERPPVELAKLLDRGYRHVDYCAVCQKGLRTFERACAALRVLLFIAGAAAAGQWAVAVLPGAPASAAIGAAVATALAAVFALVLRKVEDYKEEQFVSGLRTWRGYGGLSLVKDA